MVKKEDKKFDFSTFSIEQVANGWKVKITPIAIARGWLYFGDAGWVPPETYVFETKDNMVAWLTKHV